VNPGHHVILRVVAKTLIPVIALFAFYVQFHGDFGPGGGFQAGVILAAAIILYALIFGVEAARRAVPTWLVRTGCALGVLIYGGVGVATLLMGGEYLDYDLLRAESEHFGGQHLGIMLVELGVLITVASVMTAIFYAFAGRTPDIPDEEW
jgi:multicomponent Na+:H+ antiporter subunit B